MNFTGEDVGEWRRVHALNKALDSYSFIDNDVPSEIVIARAKEFEAYLKGEGTDD